MKPIDPNLWGASAWHILHRLSFAFRNAKDARRFYESLAIILPCPKCRESFREHIKNYRFPTNHKEIPLWCVHLHNMVNKTVGKSVFPESNIQEVKTRFAEPSEVEWTFISALIDSHPGKRYITADHVDAMHVFLSYWADRWTGVHKPSKEVIQSKALMQKWMRKNNRDVVPFGVCSTNTCELRAGGN